RRLRPVIESGKGQEVLSTEYGVPSTAVLEILMAGAKRFTDLVIWQKARLWSKKIFYAGKKEPFCRDFRLVIQINDSSESVKANIAEGFGRGTQAQFITFLGYCLG